MIVSKLIKIEMVAPWSLIINIDMCCVWNELYIKGSVALYVFVSSYIP